MTGEVLSRVPILDVFRQEPSAGLSIRSGPTSGIVVLPHIGGGHPERDKSVARLFVDNLARFLDGRPLTKVVDPAAGTEMEPYQLTAADAAALIRLKATLLRRAGAVLPCAHRVARCRCESLVVARP